MKMTLLFCALFVCASPATASAVDTSKLHLTCGHPGYGPSFSSSFVVDFDAKTAGEWPDDVWPAEIAEDQVSWNTDRVKHTLNISTGELQSLFDGAILRRQCEKRTQRKY